MGQNQEWVFWIIVASFVMPLVLSAVLIWFVTTYQRKKNEFEISSRDYLLQQQQLIIEKQQAIVEERNRIASEMHDDLGSGLTTILFLSERLKKISPTQQHIELIDKITRNSKVLVSNMSEIIWSMNSRFDDVLNLAGYMRRFASEFLDSHEVPLHFHIAENCQKQPISGTKRRDLFLVFKEILHNAVKYSQAHMIAINIDCDGILVITVDELGGKGFDPALVENRGNGIYNIGKRINRIGGQIEFRRLSNKMHTKITQKIT